MPQQAGRGRGRRPSAWGTRCGDHGRAWRARSAAAAQVPALPSLLMQLRRPPQAEIRRAAAELRPGEGHRRLADGAPRQAGLSPPNRPPPCASASQAMENEQLHRDDHRKSMQLHWRQREQAIRQRDVWFASDCPARPSRTPECGTRSMDSPRESLQHRRSQCCRPRRSECGPPGAAPRAGCAPS